MLINKAYLKDIREYEESTGKNILRLFDKISISNIVKLIKIFNGEISDEECCTLIDDYIKNENKSIIDIYEEMRNALLGYDYNGEHNTDNNDNNSYEDINSYKFLTDFYMKLCMQLMSLGVTYKEFWAFTTKEMYQVFYGIQQKIILDYNKEMQIAYNQAALIGGAVWGKLPSKPPQIGNTHSDDESYYEDETIIQTEMGEMTLGDYRLYLALEKGASK